MLTLINKIAAAKEEAWGMATEAAKTDTAKQKEFYALADKLQVALDAAIEMENEEISSEKSDWSIFDKEPKLEG